MDIRGPRLRKPSEGALRFTSSMGSDGRIAGHVIRVNLAHMLALSKAGEVDRATAAKCVGFLLSASPSIDPASKAEDFHQQLEQDAVDSLGVKTAGFLNYGKSRNDQVATAIRMELRTRVLDLIDAVCSLQSSLLDLAGKKGAAFMPGYTHLQRAQPVTLSHHLFARFDSLQRDCDRLDQLYRRVNLSPMGAAALAGTSVRIDRAYVARTLGFDGVVRNSMDAVSSRDFAAEAASCAALTMLDASGLAEELILWSTKEFGFVELSDEYSASSSIMPQKKNPVTAELARAKAGSVLGAWVAIASTLKGLPYTYNLDLQELTPHLWRAMDDAVSSAEVLAGTVRTMKVNEGSMREAVADDSSTAVALANYLVAEHRVSFRQAHSIVGELVRLSIKKGVTLSEAASASLGRVSARSGRKITIDQATARRILDPQHFLRGLATSGGSNPSSIASGTARRRKELSASTARASALRAKLSVSDRRLTRSAKGLSREVKTKS